MVVGRLRAASISEGEGASLRRGLLLCLTRLDGDEAGAVSSDEELCLFFETRLEAARMDLACLRSGKMVWRVGSEVWDKASGLWVESERGGG